MSSAQVLHSAKVVASALTSAGGMLQTDAQAQLDAEREAFQRQRDFAMGQYGAFGSLLGGVPNVGQVKASTANPYTAALSGAMMGAGFGGNIMDYFNQNRRPSYTNTGFMGPQGYQSYNERRNRRQQGTTDDSLGVLYNPTAATGIAA